ncbi:MAG: serpin family protein [Thermodesulfobacteriota bacterium]
MRSESGRSRKVILGFCLALAVLAVAVAFVRSTLSAIECKECDSTASGDISRLGACIERCENELKDLGMPDRKLKAQHLQYLVGPYYGWGGCNRKCEVRVRVVNDEVWGCALKGSAIEGGSSRYIYRTTLSGGRDLPATVGPCLGKRYGGRGETCFTESLVEPGGNLTGEAKSSAPEPLMSRPECEAGAPEIEARSSDHKRLAENAVNGFAAVLYKQLERGDKNLVFSPYTAFENQAMLFAGAGGATARQVSAVLQATKAGVPLHETMGSLTRKLVCESHKSGGTVCVANAIWVDEKEQIGQPYEGAITTNYGPRINRVNFLGDPNASAKVVGKWIERETQGFIKGDIVFPDPPSREAAPLLVTSAVYFKQDWYVKFDKELTKDGPFTLLDGETVTVPMMHIYSGFRYYEDPECQVLELPYRFSRYSIVIILPKARDGLPRVEQSLTPARLSSLLESGPVKTMKVWVPSFKFRSSVALDKPLMDLGMKDAFSMAKSDFSGIIPDRRRRAFLFASQQLGYLDVNEEGTEAAVAGIDCTAITNEGSGYVPPPTEFRADHPFLFVIRHNESNAILLMGRLTDPR